MFFQVSASFSHSLPLSLSPSLPLSHSLSLSLSLLSLNIRHACPLIFVFQSIPDLFLLVFSQDSFLHPLSEHMAIVFLLPTIASQHVLTWFSMKRNNCNFTNFRCGFVFGLFSGQLVYWKFKRHLNEKNTFSDHDSIHGHRNLNETELFVIARCRNFKHTKNSTPALTTEPFIPENVMYRPRMWAHGNVCSPPRNDSAIRHTSLVNPLLLIVFPMRICTITR